MAKKIIIFLICTSFLLTGCQSPMVKSLLPEEIVEAAIDTNENTEDYYIKSTMKILDKNELVDELFTEEWNFNAKGEAKRRTEMSSEKEGKTISILNDNELTIYQESLNEAFTISNVIKEDSSLNKSLKERTIKELDMAKKMYKVKNLGEDKINGRETYHLKGEPIKDSTLLGDYEVWIDKDNWVVAKSILKSGDTEIITENIEVDFSPKIDKSIFDLDLPDDAKKIDLDKDISGEEDITIKQADEKLGGRLLYIKDEKYTLNKIVSSSYDSEKVPDEIVFNYSKDSEGSFLISVLEKQEEMKNDGIMEFKEREIRGNKAYIMEDALSMIVFYEENLQYNMIIEDEKMTIGQAIDIIENMENFK